MDMSLSHILNVICHLAIIQLLCLDSIPCVHLPQLVVECRMTLEEAIAVYSFYNSMFEPACKYFESKDVAAFDEALGNVLNVSGY